MKCQPKSKWNCQEPQTGKQNLKGTIILIKHWTHISQFQNLQQSYINQNTMILTYTQINQQNRIQSPEINLHIYDQLVLEKGTYSIK